MNATSEMAAAVGSFPAPEGAATLSALKKLVEDNLVSEQDRVVLFNTWTGLKYIELFE